MREFFKAVLAIIAMLLTGIGMYELTGIPGVCIVIGVYILIGIMLSDLTHALTSSTPVAPSARREPSI